LQKTPVLAMAQAQTCHRSRKCTKVASEPRINALEEGLPALETSDHNIFV
jgi:hypothetical protein